MLVVAIKVGDKYFKDFTYPDNTQSNYAGWGGTNVVQQKGIELTDEKLEFTPLSAGNIVKDILYLMRMENIPMVDITFEIRDDRY